MTKKTMIAKSIENKTCQSTLVGTLVTLLALLASVNTMMAQDDNADPDRTGRLLKVELPLTGPAANRIVQQIREVASKMPVAATALLTAAGNSLN